MLFTAEEIETALQKVVDTFLIPKFHELDMDATGEWLDNLRVEAGENKGYIKGRQYTEYLTKGRPPSDTLPPISAIKKWAEIKLGLTGDDAKTAAFAIAQKIKKHGTTHYRNKGTDLLEAIVRPEVIQFLQEELKTIARGKIADRLRRNMKDYLTN